MRRLRFPLAALFALTLFAGNARSELMFTIQEVGPDVVVTASGTVNTAGLTDDGAWSSGGTGGIVPSFGWIIIPSGGDYYEGLSGPKSFGSGSGGAMTSASGDAIWLNGFDGQLGLPFGYVSGSPLSSSMTFLGTTLGDLGATPGTYTYTWGSGDNADSAVLRIGPTEAAAVPEPSSATVFGLALGLGGVVAAGRRRRRRTLAQDA